MKPDRERPEVIAAWRHMVACARAFVRCADEFDDDISVSAEYYDALERAQERLARVWDGDLPEAPAADGLAYPIQDR